MGMPLESKQGKKERRIGKEKETNVALKTAKEGCSWFLIAICLTLFPFGCAPSRKIFVDYTMPPDRIAPSHASMLKNLRFKSVTATVQGTYFKDSRERRAFESWLERYIEGEVASAIYREGAYTVSDMIFRDAKGEKRVSTALKYLHNGYGPVFSGAPDKEADIVLTADLQLYRTTGTDRIKTSLTRTPYKIKYNKDREPYAVADTKHQRTRYVISNVPFVLVKGKGTLSVQVTGSGGTNLYNNKFSNLRFEKKVGGSGPIDALPTSFEIAGDLLNDHLRGFVRDISPHRVSRELIVNENGNKTAIVLMKATAFSEAENYLDSFLDQQEKRYEALKDGIHRKFDEKIREAGKSSKSQAERDAALGKLKQLQDEQIGEAGRFLSPDYENYAICLEALGDMDEAVAFYRKAVERNPQNASARKALENLVHIYSRTRQMAP
jgi:tetratricopeptide (TPR) repeat protein